MSLYVAVFPRFQDSRLSMDTERSTLGIIVEAVVPEN